MEIIHATRPKPSEEGPRKSYREVMIVEMPSIVKGDIELKTIESVMHLLSKLGCKSYWHQDSNVAVSIWAKETETSEPFESVKIKFE